VVLVRPPPSVVDGLPKKRKIKARSQPCVAGVGALLYPAFPFVRTWSGLAPLVLAPGPAGGGDAMGKCPSGAGDAVGEGPASDGDAMDKEPAGDGDAAGEDPTGVGDAMDKGPAVDGDAAHKGRAKDPPGPGDAMDKGPAVDGDAAHEGPAEVPPWPWQCCLLLGCRSSSQPACEAPAPGQFPKPSQMTGLFTKAGRKERP